MAAMLAQVSGALDRLCRWGALFALVMMIVLIAIQVVARYVWKDPPGWTEEGARYAMVWGGLLGATTAFRLQFDPVLIKPKMLERGAGRLIALALRAIGTVLFLGPVWFFCLFGPNFDMARGFLGRSLLRTAETLGVPMIWFTAALPLAITVIFIHLLAEIAALGKPRREAT